MEQNPYESSVAEANPKSTLGITIGRIVAVAFWLLSLLVALDLALSLLLTPEYVENMKSAPWPFAIGTATTHILPSSALALLGVAAWRRSIIFAVIGLVPLLPLAYSWAR